MAASFDPLNDLWDDFFSGWIHAELDASGVDVNRIDAKFGSVLNVLLSIIKPVLLEEIFVNIKTNNCVMH